MEVIKTLLTLPGQFCVSLMAGTSYTFYYDALLVGKGLIKKSKQIIVLAQVLFLIVAYILLIRGYGIVAIVSSQLVYVLVARVLAHRVFFTKELRLNLRSASRHSRREVLKAVYPNALKTRSHGFGWHFDNKDQLYSSDRSIFPLRISLPTE